MEKALITFSLLFAFIGFDGCDKNNNANENHKHSFSSAWTTSETMHWHAATCGHDEKDQEGLHVDFNLDYKCDTCGYSLPIISWTKSEIAIFDDHLYGHELPFLEDCMLSYDSDNECVVLRKNDVNKENFLEYLGEIEAQGFNKKDGPIENTFILQKDVIFEENTKTINIDIFLQNEELVAVCYDPYYYSWPEDAVDDYVETYFSFDTTFEVPSIDAYRYLVDTSFEKSDGILIIKCESSTNLENSYKQKLEYLGFSVSKFKDENGYFVATDSTEKVEILYGFSLQNHAFNIVVSLAAKWPTTQVDFYADQFTSNSGTKVPKVIGADKYEFIEAAYDAHGYFFVLCECHNDLTEQYELALDEQYTVYNEKKNCAGNYFAISDNNDLLVQYIYVVTESPFGGEDYIHFDVLFEKYYPHNEEHIADGLQIISKGTSTTLPQYPGYGEKISFSSTNKFMRILIQSSTYDSVSEYIGILNNNGWTTREIDTMLFEYEAISPNGDIRLSTTLEDGRVILTLSAIKL